MRLRAFVCVVSLAGLSGCVDAAPAVLSPAPLVAVPGPTKTAEEFQQDDLACRAVVAEPPHDLKKAPTALQPAADGSPPGKDTNAPIRMEASPQPVVQPGVAYLRCMGSRYNIVEPLSVSQTVTYGSYPAYPVYGGSTDYYPWLYDGYYGGFYNGFCCGVGFGFGRGFYGHGFYGGGYGGRGYYGRGFGGGGFRGAGGYRGGGGFGGGGFRGGGGGGFQGGGGFGGGHGGGFGGGGGGRH